MITFAERFNGTGAADNGWINPYLFSGTNIYVKGKYGSDGKWDSELIDAQVGVYLLIKQIMTR
jgi:lysozyme family protein